MQLTQQSRGDRSEREDDGQRMVNSHLTDEW